MNDPAIETAFDPAQFREQGHLIVDQLADALDKAHQGQGKVRSKQTPEEAAAFWKEKLEGDPSPHTLIGSVLEHAFRCHHPHNLGHQVGPVLPAAALADLAGSLLDTGNGVFEVGNPATAMERVVLQDLAEKIGFPETADGILTSGGSLGNLTALLAMRQCQAGSWDKGSGCEPGTVLVSEEAHYCVTRAVKIMGWGDQGITRVEVDSDFRMSLSSLEDAYRSALSRGQKVLGVIGSAGSTATGRIDPLEGIAEFCRKHDLWFHIDAAHAGAFVYSRTARELLSGIELADSVVVDFHKMLLSPSLLTAVMFRNGADSFETFAQKADYLWRQDQSHEWWDAAKRTLECTRPMLGLRAFALLQAGKNGLFETYIDQALAMTHRFAELLREAGDFELLAEPESNIICYRYVAEAVAEEEFNIVNRKIREAIVDSGDFYVVQVEKKGKVYLRSALMNPNIDEAVLLSLMDRIREEGNNR